MKVYISSTYRDLHRQRAAVAAVLRRMGHQPIGMEEYTAEGAKPLHRCLDDVIACDVYVGIIAWRYGFMPTNVGDLSGMLPAGTPPDTTSITEYEYRQAVKSEKQVLMFLLDIEAEWSSIHFDAVSGEGEQGKAISRLREQVGQQYVVNYFRTAEELASLVSAAVYRAEISRQMNLEKLNLEPRFNQSFFRTGSLNDSSLRDIKNVIAGTEIVQALQINVGNGREWWMTRLYFLSSLAADLTSIDIVLFLDEANNFIGILHPKFIKDCLAQTFPMIKQYENTLALSATCPCGSVWTGSG